MKPPYWFKRASSTLKTPLKTYSSAKQAASKTDILIPDETLKNQLKNVAQKLMAIVQNFQKIKSFNSIYQESGPNKITGIRCPTHNSGIILYCSNDHRLLCSNCVFGVDTHKRHSIVEATKASSMIETDIKDTEKVLKITANQFTKEKIGWEELLDNMDQSYRKTLQALDRDHEQSSAALATIFLRNRQKIEEIFGGARESLQTLIKSFTQLIKGMRYDHPIMGIRHIYLQEVVELRIEIQRLLPNVKTGNQMAYMLERYGVNVIKSYKSSTNFLNQ